MNMDRLNKNSEGVNNRMSSEKEFEEAFRYYYRPLFLFAYGYVMSEEEAENIVQSVFAGMWENRKRLPENLNLKAYLYSSVKHACLRYFRRLRLLDEYKKRQAEALVLSFADDDVEDDKELVALVQQALSKLSEQQRKIVELHVMEGKKYLEIAEQLALSENTVRTHLKRAYKILRENLSCLFLDIFI
ncbi:MULTISPECIES: RNA polymerase sigma-70 factor [Butyricimonas]|jgi:RNA polymerase sigma-70 factor|uniref:RNA polymerase sigma-70 factor n=2 Tax=Odoribacteraceae TaxID=1853231 RepID=A0ABR7D6N9_9BACT|nr:MULTISPECIES: RNA polymerase sigma-70 factor [Butyricimonas]MBC5623564.1 RNA polymerase sigma-70 factor [Butyricimonas hominis]MCG4521089.1 RNA polymerase sigma-70 factor [Butyricimonas sp. DFI.6.44]